MKRLLALLLGLLARLVGVITCNYGNWLLRRTLDDDAEADDGFLSDLWLFGRQLMQSIAGWVCGAEQDELANVYNNRPLSLYER